ncbi:dipeptidyl-peptidase III [Sporobolomyces salmoneus]|uniref:dipeptidyl-peptidase III n=1 Tax=Sporobolomyces salmoneus TaxID=183962 RepID=UPI00316CDF84
MLSSLSKRLGSAIGSTTRLRTRSPSTSPNRSSSNMVSQADQRYLADKAPPVCSLQIKDSFSNLTKEEKLYSHYISKACWSGGRIIMRQTTDTAEQLCDLIISTFGASDQAPNKLGDFGQLKSKSGVTQEDWEGTLAYCAQVLSNLSNMKSFGATKFIPRSSESAFRSIVAASPRASTALPLFDSLSSTIYFLTPAESLSIGFPADGHVSSYYPGELKPTKAEIEAVQELCTSKGVSTLNTRLTKNSDKFFTLLIASVDKQGTSSSIRSDKDGIEVELKYGDYSACLENVNKALEQAKKFAADSNKQAMLTDYQRSFKTGSVDAHKEGTAKWVKDVGPVVENYIGFIEDYVDPSGSRAEWEGFCAIVNKEESKKFGTLVDRADQLIKDLPWGKDFEASEFKRPDFTALEILSFATSGIPSGINLGNYHDIREQYGFKNLSLSNILSAKAPNEAVPFIHPDEMEAHNYWSDRVFSVQVANHELLGHGTGRLLQENQDGTLPFDPKKIINPLTGKPVDSWYKFGETYGSRMGPISSSMEECRAEAVAMYLASNPEILEIFGYNTQEEKDDCTYWSFLVMVRAGVRALEFYDPVKGVTEQAHMRARLGITNWLIDNKIASIEFVRDEKDGSLVDAYARVDRQACLSRSKEVMGKLLLEIQTRKSTGDRKGAEEFFDKLTKPTNEWVEELRPLVLSKKLPRKIFVQPNTRVIGDNEDVELIEYPVTVEGVIQSFVEREL